MPQDNDQNYNVIYTLYCHIDRHLCQDIRYPGNNQESKNLQDLQKRLRQEQEINLLEKCGSQTLGGEVLNLAVKWNNSRVVKFLLININKEQSKLDLNSKEYKEYQTLKKKAKKIAIKNGNSEIVKLFAEYKEVPNKTEKCNTDSKSCVETIAKNQENTFYDIDAKIVSYYQTRRDFRISLVKDYMGGMATLALIVASIMSSSDAFKAVFGVLAVLVAIGTGLHIKNSTIPSYVEMQENSVVCLNHLNSIEL
ncbi:hypothetical protein IC220_01380 [Wolbachia endosymbiont of Pentalonia nigronervosa]|nr:hypothetical protein [Wolbachia endosymbiont of Pentalonia nigronervosa]